MSKEKRLEQKKHHDAMVEIRKKIENGTSTFAERNWLKIQEKKRSKNR